ncbi:hypothetical protein PSN45_002670 [Yamadazyma tenuis]|uniref:Thioredoxin-like protein n=1 Tax=Candida tenuis (strain ATCC 10573 / BCRC 21748 / CBS 615 / JCM 9827 / NBRC 10315 / NRRL Y-1498 / VKM Y-70) TaxID=590646 RepID=G3AX78_CANTC|nr:thioredoxin-like protein [Yamadazyma tenuis ATCC 10573]EGV66712.1 thioredoxin-like protein [Yamadazyma tenuis ATCC 10573]WEJ95157.1 hypothetical protein PSN45_002670 [Yamadazyma tenuis]
MDNKQAQLVEQYQEAKLQGDYVDDDDLLELLDEDDSVLQQYRASRIQQLSQEFKAIDDAHSSGSDFGSVQHFDNEKKLMETVARTDYAIVHFYQPGFAKCNIMNNKLSLLAEKHLTVKVCSIKAEEAPFLVNKLNVKVLPFVVIYKSGKELDRLVGFERLGNDPSNFSYSSLEAMLLRLGVLQRKTINFASTNTGSNTHNDDDEESDLDL